MTKSKVVIVDYGMGNLWSVQNALRYLGCNPKVTENPDDVFTADSILLPGVGSFRKAMLSLQEKGLDQAIIEATQKKGTKILGICLGMQLMGAKSSEDGDTAGLGLIPAEVKKFSAQEVGKNKIPHIGFDLVKSYSDSVLFRGLKSASYFYFVHSYRMMLNGLCGITSTCNYGVKFLAAYEQSNIFATQFHPEKSQTNGLILLRNFLAK